MASCYFPAQVSAFKALAQFCWRRTLSSAQSELKLIFIPTFQLSSIYGVTRRCNTLTRKQTRILSNHGRASSRVGSVAFSQLLKRHLPLLSVSRYTFRSDFFSKFPTIDCSTRTRRGCTGFLCPDKQRDDVHICTAHSQAFIMSNRVEDVDEISPIQHPTYQCDPISFGAFLTPCISNSLISAHTAQGTSANSPSVAEGTQQARSVDGVRVLMREGILGIQYLVSLEDETRVW